MQHIISFLYEDMFLLGGLALCLNSSMKIRFVPANYSKLWSIQQAMGCSWIKARVWMSLSHTKSGFCNISGDANRLFSQQAVQMSVTRNGCDDVPGSMRQPDSCGRCGRKKISNIHCPCDGVPASGAVLGKLIFINFLVHLNRLSIAARKELLNL